MEDLVIKITIGKETIERSISKEEVYGYDAEAALLYVISAFTDLLTVPLTEYTPVQTSQ